MAGKVCWASRDAPSLRPALPQPASRSLPALNALGVWTIRIALQANVPLALPATLQIEHITHSVASGDLTRDRSKAYPYCRVMMMLNVSRSVVF